MATETKVSIYLDVNALGNGVNVKDTFIDGTAPEIAIHIPQQVQETADTAEALTVTGVDTIRGIWIRSIDGDINIDTSYVAPDFSAEILVREGQSAFFVPTGTVYIENAIDLETVTFEFVCLGTQT